MYIPSHYQSSDAFGRAVVRASRVADFVSATPAGPISTLLPYVYDEQGGRIVAHFSRANEHWKVDKLGQTLAIVHGEDAYVSAAWYPSTRDAGGSGPTWNYVLAHVYGELVIHDDPDWVLESIRALIDLNEGDRGSSWSLDDVSEEYMTSRVRGVVGFELLIDRIEAKAKLSQNRPPEDIECVTRHLRREGRAIADDMDGWHRSHGGTSGESV